MRLFLRLFLLLLAGLLGPWVVASQFTSAASTTTSTSTFNSYLYCGEQWDADLGLYFNRARYLNVATGRFWSMDTYEGAPSDPVSLHKYLYANANPVTGIDPSGNMTIAEVNITAAVIGLTAAIATPHFRRALQIAYTGLTAAGTSLLSQMSSVGALEATSTLSPSKSKAEVDARIREKVGPDMSNKIIFLHGGNMSEWQGAFSDPQPFGRGDFGPGFYTFRFPEGIPGAFMYAQGKVSGTADVGFISVFAISQNQYDMMSKKNMIGTLYNPGTDFSYDVLYGPLSGSAAILGTQYKFQARGLTTLAAGYVGTIPIVNPTTP
jgi:RHS repeat-associated protein